MSTPTTDIRTPVDPPIDVRAHPIRCSLGNHTVPPDAFGVNRASPTGRCHSCRKCQAARRRLLHPVATPRPVRERKVIGGVPYVSCRGCGLRPSREFPVRRNTSGSTCEGSYCCRCANRRRLRCYLAKLAKELHAPVNAPTPLMDRAAALQAQHDARRAAARHEERRLLLTRAQFFLGRLRDRGWSWQRIADGAGICYETARRWSREDVPLPDKPPMMRALAFWEWICDDERAAA